MEEAEMEVSSVGDHVSVQENGALLLFNTIDSGLYRIEPITKNLLILIRNMVQKLQECS